MSHAPQSRFMRALFREPVDRTPVWIMRQAGRYLPEYRKLRAEAKSFLRLCKTPELACTVTLQPLARFPLDAAIIFSDILTIPDALGLGLHFSEGEGPKFERPIRSHADIRKLAMLDPETELKYVMDAIRMTVQALDGSVPLIGFAGSPWTVATYMIEGGGSKQFSIIKAMLYQDPNALHALLKHVAELTVLYLGAQLKAGASAVMIFDTWGGLLAKENYLEFSLDYMHLIIEGLKAYITASTRVPVILFTKNGGQHVEAIADTGCEAIGLDWTADLKHVKHLVGHRVALQGNLDPSVLYGDTIRIQEEVAKVLSQFGSGPGHVFNLGHGIHQDVEPEKVAVMIEAVHRFSEKV
jgi:uroporphyrinogen decarboxylase